VEGDEKARMYSRKVKMKIEKIETRQLSAIPVCSSCKIKANLSESRWRKLPK